MLPCKQFIMINSSICINIVKFIKCIFPSFDPNDTGRSFSSRIILVFCQLLILWIPHWSPGIVYNSVQFATAFGAEFPVTFGRNPSKVYDLLICEAVVAEKTLVEGYSSSVEK